MEGNQRSCVASDYEEFRGFVLVCKVKKRGVCLVDRGRRLVKEKFGILLNAGTRLGKDAFVRVRLKGRRGFLGETPVEVRLG